MHADGAHGETELPTKRSCPTRPAFTAAAKTELSNEKELPESHADAEHVEMGLHDETELNTQCSSDQSTQCSGDPNTQCSGDPNTQCSGNQTRGAAATQTRGEVATSSQSESVLGV